MLAHYYELVAELERIRRYLRAISKERPSSDHRIFTYVACISALYAAFESYAERLAFRFTQIMLDSPDFLTEDELNKLRKRYAANASALLSQNLGSGRYQDVTQLDVAKSLASCLDESSAYDIRLEVLSLHSANLRWDTLASLFGWVIEDLRASVAKSDAVDKWLALRQSSDKTAAESIDRILDDLIERRNEVAHRGIPAEILSPDSIIDIVEYIEVISLGIISCLGGRILDTSRAKGDSTSLGNPSKYYQNNRVVIIPSLPEKIAEGDVVWASNATTTRWGRVLEVQLDSVKVPHAQAGEEAGLNLDFAVPRNSNLYRWHTPADDLSPPPTKIFGNSGPLEAVEEPALTE